MALTVTYTVVNGEILHENRNGVESFYVPDPLGNTAMLVNTSGAVTDTWNYWPYGETQVHGGSSETPFTYGGTQGCYTGPSGSVYMRAREVEPALANWLTVDPVWPQTGAYSYANCRPSSLSDPLGRRPAHCRAQKARLSGGGASGEGSEGIDREPCFALLKEGPESKEWWKLVDCLRKAKKDTKEIRKCIAEGGKGVTKSNIIHYITCEAVQGFPGFSDGPGNPCKPITEQSCDACCDMRYQNCLWDCSEKTGASWGLCVTKCYYAVHGLVNCEENCVGLQ